MMSALLMNECLPSEVGDSDTYNRIQMRHAVQSRGDPNAESPICIADDVLRVLIVDDNHAMADCEFKLIRLWGHDVSRAYDGSTALAFANAYLPDILLLDLNMPEMSGLEVSRRVRQQDCLKKCFIVVVTGRTESTLWPLCMQAGVDLILVKPVAPSILKALLTWEAEYVLRSRNEAPADFGATARYPRANQDAMGFSLAIE
jgi:DNA-binding response OmpR family regulator